VKEGSASKIRDEPPNIESNRKYLKLKYDVATWTPGTGGKKWW